MKFTNAVASLSLALTAGFWACNQQDTASSAVCQPIAALARGPWAVPFGQSLLVRFEAAPEQPALACVTVTQPDGVSYEAQARSYLREGASIKAFASSLADAGSFRLYEVTLAVDAPGDYSWQIAGSAGSFSGQARIAAADGSTSVLVIGDTNNNTPVTDPDTGAETDAFVTQELMDQAMAAGAPDVLIHTGDIAYHAVPPQDGWQGFWRSFGPHLPKTVFLPATGNHEYEFENEFETYMRAWFGVTSATTIAYDANGAATASRNGQGHVLAYNRGPLSLLTINSNLDELSAAEQDAMWDELDFWLQNAGDAWKVVIFHHPIYTQSKHAPQLDIREKILELDAARDIHLVLTGHNHVYERFQPAAFDNIVSGGGGAYLYDLDSNPAEEDAPRVAGSAAFHTLRLNVTPAEVELKATAFDGTVIDEATLTKR